MSEKTGKKKISKLRTETERSSLRSRKLRFDKIEEPSKGKFKRENTVTKAVSVNRAVHNQFSRADEDENAGVKAGDLGVETAEDAVKAADKGVYRAKLKAYRKEIGNGEQPVVSVEKSGVQGSNQISKRMQKTNIKKEYAAARYGKSPSGKGAGEAEKSAKKAAEKSRNLLGKLTKFMGEHYKFFLILLAVMLLFVTLFTCLSFGSTFLQGSVNAVITSSYTAEDDEIIGAENDYRTLESALQNYIDSVENLYPGYDEYRYFVDEISHDPYQLASYLTVMYSDYKRREVQPTLQSLFEKQYELELEEATESCPYTETDSETAVSEESQTLCQYRILNVTLRNRNLDNVIRQSGGMNGEQWERYELLNETKGNKAYLFADE